MKKVLVLCKGTGQSVAFKKSAEEYASKEGNIELLFVDNTKFTDTIANETVDCVAISPEMMVIEAKVKSILDEAGIKYLSIKPSDFGLRRVEKVVEAIEAL